MDHSIAYPPMHWLCAAMAFSAGLDCCRVFMAAVHAHTHVFVALRLLVFPCASTSDTARSLVGCITMHDAAKQAPNERLAAVIGYLPMCDVSPESSFVQVHSQTEGLDRDYSRM